ncbi:methyl-accepting chemotaxis sensory transducer [Natronorubrum tibetense GA33]|uniref:Methyl-accepting chemotaxis sensory transducer n=1 Tax=Natronorubrum tibetense GA33 TaxID=1114856 RepID=L9VW29_9EURY|nr:hypothetical protein [Natronorubrum tibetense]ELY41221.1 methyl-accepting chemotaxis sensory transducer [Natronorubrum tibetense GA33]
MASAATDISETTVQEAQHVAAAAEEQTSALAKVSENANSLAGQAAHLSEALDRFDTDRSSQSWSTDAGPELTDEADGEPETGTELSFEADDALETDAEQTNSNLTETDAEQTDDEDSATAEPEANTSEPEQADQPFSFDGVDGS